MKVLIWIVTAFVFVLLNELLGSLIGFKLGYVILFLLISTVATALTKAMLGEEAVSKNKKAKKNSAAPPVNHGPFPGGWTCAQCGTHQAGDANFCDICGNPKPAAPQQNAMHMTRPQPVESMGPMTQPQPIVTPEPPMPQPVHPQFDSYAAPQSYQPPVPQPQPYYAPPHPSSEPQQPAAQPGGAIKFYVSSLNTEVNVTRASFTVGRDATSDLNLARLPNAKYIARRQASFFCSGGQWYIRDENSTNGTFLNNRRLSGGQPHPLNKGDFISFAGKETLIVQDLK